MLVWIQANIELILAVALGLSEVLGMIPVVKSNSIFQLIVNGLKAVAGIFKPADKIDGK